MPIVAVFLAFFIMGFVDAVGVLVGYARAQFALSATAAALLPLLGFAAFAVVSIPAGVLASRHGRRAMLCAGLALVLAGELVAVAGTTRYIGLLAAIGLLGIGMATVQVAGNPLVRDVSEPDRYARNLSLAQFVKSLGSNTAPLVIPAAVAVGWSWTAVFPIFGAATAVALACALAVSIRESRSVRAATFASSVALALDRRIAPWLTGIFLYVGAEVGIASSIASHLRASLAVDLDDATRCIALFLGALAVGRLLGGVVLAITSARRLLAASAITALAATAALLVPSTPIVLVALVVAGLAYANVWPLVFALAIETRPARASEISGLLCTAILGGAIVPFAMGIVADLATWRVAFAIPVACCAYLVRLARRA
jgi:fucose permease